jgi:mRNA-degrading endonuclease toxin of MazEF toxin-antitoxin module
VSIGRAPPPTGPRKGDIFILELPEVGGHVQAGRRPAVVVQAGRRPAVVVQADRFARSGTVIVCPMTSAAPRDALPRPHRVAVDPRDSGLDRAGWVKADQPATVPAAILHGPVGRLAPEVIARVDAALRFVLDV